MSRTKAEAAAQERYHSKLRQIKIWLNPETEADITDALDKEPNKAEYIKGLIRNDISQKTTE